MKNFSYTIKDKEGIHARPAELLVKLAATYPCAVKICKDSKEADAKRIFAVMGLAVKCGETIEVIADGEKEEDAIAELETFMKDNL